MKLLSCLWFVLAVAASLAPARSDAATECVALPQTLVQTLQQHGWGAPGSYVGAFHNLDGRGSPEAIVLLTGRQFCGSGGCTLVVLQPEGEGWRLVSKTTLVHPPVRVLHTRHNGWATLSVQVGGGGIVPGYTALLPFQGSGYPANPTVSPAIRSHGNVVGSTLISSYRCSPAVRS
jgi:hypothetical protein